MVAAAPSTSNPTSVLSTKNGLDLTHKRSRTRCLLHLQLQWTDTETIGTCQSSHGFWSQTPDMDFGPKPSWWDWAQLEGGAEKYTVSPTNPQNLNANRQIRANATIVNNTNAQKGPTTRLNGFVPMLWIIFGLWNQESSIYNNTTFNMMSRSLSSWKFWMMCLLMHFVIKYPRNEFQRSLSGIESNSITNMKP